jgi:hypothetical protein
VRISVLKWFFVTAGIAILAIIIARERAATAQLRAEAERARATQAELAKLREEQTQLTTQQVSARELARLRSAHDEAMQLRSDTARLRSETAPSSSGVDAGPLGNWRNAGRDTPEATFRTGVWAIMQGDTDALAQLIAFNEAGRAKLMAMFDRLPEATRAEYGTAENVFATLLAVRLPQDLVSATPITTTMKGPDETTLRMHLERAEAAAKDTNFHFSRSSDGWRIVVPLQVVEDYEAMLTYPLPVRAK